MVHQGAHALSTCFVLAKETPTRVDLLSIFSLDHETPHITGEILAINLNLGLQGFHNPLAQLRCDVLPAVGVPGLFLGNPNEPNLARVPGTRKRSGLDRDPGMIMHKHWKNNSSVVLLV